MVRIGPLSEDKRKVLRGLRRRAVGRVAERAQMVLLSARGYAVPQIAEIFEVGEDTVPHVAAPLPGARTRRAGGLAAAGQAPEGLPGPADRGHPDAQLPARQWAGPSVLDRRAAGRLLGRPLPAGAVRPHDPATPARQRLALGAATPGRGHPRPTRAAQGGSRRSAEAAADRAGAQFGCERAVPGRVRPAPVAGG